MITRLVMIICCVVVVGWGDAQRYEYKIISMIVHALIPNRSVLYLYSDDPSRSQVLFAKSRSISLVDHPEKADLLLLFTPKMCREWHKPVVAVGRRVFKVCHMKAAAFYWFKGRPNVIFCQEWLREHGRILHPSLQSFVDRCTLQP